ncbi:MAG: TonB-dependent receptor [Bacteroidetes bacterium]|nr:TonB-dependent receptor [Bacteroidota bacterium]
MKNITTIFIVLFLLSTHFYSQNSSNAIESLKLPEKLHEIIDQDFGNVTLGFALNKIAELGDIEINFNSEVIPVKYLVRLEFRKEKLLKGLLSVLSQSGTSIRLVNEDQIVVIPGKNPDTSYIIKGNVKDAKSQEVLPGVNIVVMGSNIGVITNTEGNYSIEDIHPGIYNLRYSFIGYESKFREIIILPDHTVTTENLMLDESAFLLKEVTVTPGKFSILGDVPASQQMLTKDEFSNVTFAEDIYRSIKRLPGVSSNDFSAKFNVRGGETDEVLVELDGLQLFEPYHMKDFYGGILSTIDVYTIGGVNLFTGSYPAEFGNKMSGVFDISTQNVLVNEKKLTVGLSMMNARILSKGTFDDNNGTWLLSARRGYLDLVLGMINDGEEFPSPTYYDMLGKVTYKLSENHSLALNLLIADDSMDYLETDLDRTSSSYGNKYVWLTLKSFYGSKLYSRSIMSFGNLTHYRSGTGYFDDQAQLLEFTVMDDRDFNTFTLKQDWNWDFSEDLFVKWGFDFNYGSASYDYNTLWNRYVFDASSNNYTINTQLRELNLNPVARNLGLYFSTKFQLAEPFTVELGGRYTYTSNPNSNSFDPRLNFAYAISNRTFIRGGWGLFHQTTDINEMAVEFGEKVIYNPQQSKHILLGFEHHFTNGLLARVEGYFKDNRNIKPQFREFLTDPGGEVFPQFMDNTVEFEIDHAVSKGLEVFLKYDTGDKLSWWFSYVLSFKDEKVIKVNTNQGSVLLGGYFPGYNNQKHTINFDLNYRPATDWHINLAWQFHSGWPRNEYYYVTLQDESGNDYFDTRFHDYNSLHYPDYNRIDLRINKFFKTSLGTISVFFEVINLFNQNNVRAYRFNEVQDRFGSRPRVVKYGEKWLPRLPSLGVSWEIDI